MKKVFLLTTVLCLTLTMTACTRPTNQEYYEEAQLYLGSGECETASLLFSQLGEYEDSAEYALYCAGLHALKEGDYERARTDLESIHPFKSSGRYLQYLEGLELEEEDDLEGALAIFTALGSFEDSAEMAEELKEAIPEAAMQQGRELMSKGDYAAARDIFLSLGGYGQSAAFASNCTMALNKAAYREADALCQAGDHLAAMRAFLALGDALDAPDRAAKCRASLTERLESMDATLTTAADLIAAYDAIGDEEAIARAASLTEQFGVNLQVIASAKEQPYVLLGSYPMGESGLESDVMWRVIKAEGERLTLLCETVLDASPIATTTDLALSETPEKALTGFVLPSMADLTALSDPSCAATPYALAQGVPQQEGEPLYWLRDSLESGLHPVIAGSGSLSIPDKSLTPGLRPMVTLSLNEFAFTAGSGTKEDPFR